MINMTINEAIKKGIEILKEYSDTAWLDVSVILAHILNKERWYLTAHGEEILKEDNISKYLSLINKRLEGVPVQYITGHQEFMSLDFIVNQAVLIPRPETEILVEQVLKFISTFSSKKNIKILDVGTGSGCISISIAKNTDNTFIKAVDISEEALKVARQNAKLLGVKDRIQFLHSNLFQNINEQNFDVLVSNPPYIPSKIIKSLQKEVRKYEPCTALDGGNDGLDYYRKIIQRGYKYLKTKGLLAFEIGYDQADKIKAIINGQGNYSEVRIIKDFSDKDRIVITSKK